MKSLIDASSIDTSAAGAPGVAMGVAVSPGVAKEDLALSLGGAVVPSGV